MKWLYSLISKEPKNSVLFVIMVCIVLILTLALPGKFLTGINFTSMASQFPEFGILALAMMLVMITGGIDLSVIAIANLSGVMAALVLSSPLRDAMPVVLLIGIAIFVALATSLLCGVLNGLLIAAVGVPPILATLGSQGLFLGIAIIITGGHSISGFPSEFMAIGNNSIIFLPIPFLIFVIIALLISLLLKRTRQGFNMFMIGSNSVISKFSGVDNRRVLLQSYVVSALLAGLASIIIISRVNSMRPGYGQVYLLQAILVAVLGGTAPEGGFGNVAGVVMAVIILQITQSGLNLLSFSPFFKKFMWGLALLCIMAMNFLSQRYQEHKQIQKTIVRRKE